MDIPRALAQIYADAMWRIYAEHVTAPFGWVTVNLCWPSLRAQVVYWSEVST